MCPCENNCKITWLVPVSHPPCTHDHPRGNTSPEMEAKRQHRIIVPADSPPGTFTSGLFTPCSASSGICVADLAIFWWQLVEDNAHLPIILVHYMYTCLTYEYCISVFRFINGTMRYPKALLRGLWCCYPVLSSNGVFTSSILLCAISLSLLKMKLQFAAVLS